MIYKQVKPHPALADYVDAFWNASSDDKQTETILPDGCVDVILNAGEDCKTDNGSFNIKNESVYLVGTMTHFKMVEMNPGTRLFGIRFKPGGFSAFYKFDSLHEITDRTVEFKNESLPDFKQIINNPSGYLNRFLVDKFTQPRHTLLPILADIESHKGQISVVLLAKRHFVTVRQLERMFKQHVGVTPKEFINWVRYRFVLPVIRSRSAERNLLDVALEHGYYDHAHLTNEIKRYTGVTPSQF